MFVWPEYEDLRETMVEAETTETELDNLVNFHDSMDEMVWKFEDEYSEEIKIIEDGVPEDHYAPSFFKLIDDTAENTGIRIESLGSFDINSADGPRDLSEVEISLSAEGGYANFKNFISRLSNKARLISINNLAIETRREDDEETLLPIQYNLDLVIYFEE